MVFKGRKVRPMGELVHGYFPYVNQHQVPKVFMTREEAEEDAKPHIQSKAALQIKTTWGWSALGIIRMI